MNGGPASEQRICNGNAELVFLVARNGNPLDAFPPEVSLMSIAGIIHNFQDDVGEINRRLIDDINAIARLLTASGILESDFTLPVGTK
jgi:hypothetical protein